MHSCIHIKVMPLRDCKKKKKGENTHKYTLLRYQSDKMIFETSNRSLSYYVTIKACSSSIFQQN